MGGEVKYSGFFVDSDEFTKNDLGLQISEIKALSIFKTDVSNDITLLERGKDFSLDFSSGTVFLTNDADVGDKFSLFSTELDFLTHIYSSLVTPTIKRFFINAKTVLKTKSNTLVNLTEETTFEI